MSNCIDVFIVKQERGQDSEVRVYEENQGSRKALRFVSDQLLTSNSERAWNVQKAIENYAKPLGFDANNKSGLDKLEWLIFYDARFHSSMIEFALREQIKADRRYLDTQAANRAAANQINRQYGVAIRQLKNLMTALENRNREEIDRLNDELKNVQAEIFEGFEIPEALSKPGKEHLLAWTIDPVKIDAYANYGQGYVAQGNAKFPTDLNSILALLKKEIRND